MLKEVIFQRSNISQTYITNKQRIKIRTKLTVDETLRLVPSTVNFYSYLYHKYPKGTVARCQSECPSNSRHIGGKSKSFIKNRKL